MRYAEVKEFTYEPELFLASDAQTALKIHAEYTCKASARPRPRFLEVDRAATQIDPVFHAPVAPRLQFTPRVLEIPAIVRFEKPQWIMSRVALTPNKKYKFWMSRLSLKEFDYFPTRGDLVGYDGYRLFITGCVPDPESYWQQTGVWLGIIADAQIYPEGDSRPLDNVMEPAPVEIAPLPPSAPRSFNSSNLPRPGV